MNGGASPEVIVAIQAEIGDLKAKLADAQNAVARSTQQMQATVARNDPFSDFKSSLRSMVFGVGTITSGIGLAAAAMSSFAGKSEEALQTLQAMPFGIGVVAGRIRAMTESYLRLLDAGEGRFKSEEEGNAEVARIERETAANRKAVETRNAAKATASDLEAQRRIIQATNEEERINLELQRELAKIEEARRANVLGGMTETQADAIANAATGLASAKQQAAFQKIAEERARIQAEENEKAEQWMRENRLRNQRNEREKRIRENIEADRREIESLTEQRMAAEEQIRSASGVRGANFVGDVESAIGSFRFGQRDGAAQVNASMLKMIELQDKLVDINKQIAEYQKDIKFALSVVGGPS